MGEVMAGPSWIDTHCHLQLLDDAAAAVADAETSGVGRVVCVGIDAATSASALASADGDAHVYPTVGLHPHEASDLDVQWSEIERMSAHEAVVAVGECGLDFYRDHSPHDAQEAAFRRQIDLAKRRGRALVIHTRDAWDACWAILEDEGPPERFVFHCFSGGPDEMRRCVDIGGHVSFAGPITYPKNDALREAARAAPGDRIVVETDAPFLSPQQYRGKTNYPARVALVGDALAAARSAPVGEVAELTSANAAHLFGI